ncbi:hypothetical protein Q1695_016070 [Nippostrongylus brasiliensis]|nr:hypothetical protein Q1695_016070 [Nippostrongylus brasiliensis]
MPSADLAKSQFKYQGVLKLHGEVGDIKHALDEASSRSLEQINFDPSHNELVVIGSAVENIELASEDVSSARDPKSSASKANMGNKQAQKVSASAEKLPSVGSSREALAAEADPSLVVANMKSSTTIPNTTVSQPNSRESSSAVGVRRVPSRSAEGRTSQSRSREKVDTGTRPHLPPPPHPSRSPEISPPRIRSAESDAPGKTAQMDGSGSTRKGSKSGRASGSESTSSKRMMSSSTRPAHHPRSPPSPPPGYAKSSTKAQGPSRHRPMARSPTSPRPTHQRAQGPSRPRPSASPVLSPRPSLAGVSTSIDGQERRLSAESSRSVGAVTSQTSQETRPVRRVPSAPRTRPAISDLFAETKSEDSDEPSLGPRTSARHIPPRPPL